MNGERKKEPELVFRYQTKSHEVASKIATYLSKSLPPNEKRHMILTALKAFCLPDALKNTGNYTPEEIRKAASTAIYLLSVRIADLRIQFDIDLDVQSFNSLNTGTEVGSTVSYQRDDESDEDDDFLNNIPLI